MKSKRFKIKIVPSNISQEEKRQALTQSFDILLSLSSKKKKRKSKQN
jgi:hypothetical protein